ncbi:hypothetical protein PHISP_03972 [Aspergillus sp. HF37]|nr:hypothetical protein PHISP_03972 [Aspergillus sp. HF37]
MYCLDAMRPSGRNGIPAATNQRRRETPDITNATLRPSAKRTSTSKRKSGSPIPSGSSSKFRRRDTPVDSRAQQTLTQIDFVGKSQDPELDDDDLDYTGWNGTRDDAQNTNEVTQTGDGEDDPDYLSLPSPRHRWNRGSRLDQNMKTTMPNKKNVRSASRDKNADAERRSRKKSETPKASAGVKSSKKNSKDKERKERNKTLTQMDFVQRWVKLESDDDTALDYMYYTPKDRRKSNEPHLGDVDDYANTSESKRRKLNEDHDSKNTKALEDVPPEQKPLTTPVTPQKRRNLEIPSSQSPESPGLAVISSSQFRSATRSPLKQVCTNVPPVVPEDSPGSRQEKKTSQNSGHASDAGNTMSTMSRSLPNSQAVPQPLPNEKPASNNDLTPTISQTKIPASKTELDEDPQSNSAERRGTVVYETDGETDSVDFHDDLSCTPASPKKQTLADDHDRAVENDHEGSHNDSQDLPPALSEPDTESGPPHYDPPMSSDASICYRRIEKPTQYPLGSIPQLNTQKMAELFPQDSSAQLETTAALETQPPPSAKPHPSHELRAETQNQDMDTMSTEIVPESSPVARRDDEADSNSPAAAEPRRKSVIQVESSQPADRFNRRTNAEDTHPQGVISRSELLSSSVMESVPIPQFLMGSSQDSVGEPYSVPEG